MNSIATGDISIATIMVAMEMEPVAMEFMAVTWETKVVGQRLQLY